MQTFLPDADHYQSARVLHPVHHLGNQLYREGLTLLRGGWRNHPASRMWRGYERELAAYLLALLDELRRRGRWYGRVAVELRKARRSFPKTGFPQWLGDQAFHAAHRSNLLRKDSEKGWDWYAKLGWTEKTDIPYVWPEGERRNKT